MPEDIRAIDMSMRDFFAACALTGMSSTEGCTGRAIAEQAKHAYEIADAIIRERDQS